MHLAWSSSASSVFHPSCRTPALRRKLRAQSLRGVTPFLSSGNSGTYTSSFPRVRAMSSQWAGASGAPKCRSLRPGCQTHRCPTSRDARHKPTGPVDTSGLQCRPEAAPRGQAGRRCRMMREYAIQRANAFRV